MVGSTLSQRLDELYPATRQSAVAILQRATTSALILETPRIKGIAIISFTLLPSVSYGTHLWFNVARHDIEMGVPVMAKSDPKATRARRRNQGFTFLP